MVGPAAVRQGVAHLRTVFEISERRACSILQADRKMVRYRSCRSPETAVRERLHALAADPADAKEADPRRPEPWLHLGRHGVINAFRKPSGRSRVASRASSSRSSG